MFVRWIGWTNLQVVDLEDLTDYEIDCSSVD